MVIIGDQKSHTSQGMEQFGCYGTSTDDQFQCDTITTLYQIQYELFVKEGFVVFGEEKGCYCSYKNIHIAYIILLG